MKTITTLTSLLFSIFLLAGCNKRTISGIDYFSAVIDGNPRAFSYASAVYEKGTNCILINANTVKGENILIRAYLASPGPLGTSIFGANGTNTAIFIEDHKRSEPVHPVGNPSFYSFSDENQPDLEGHLTITKLDELNGKISGTLAFKTYNRKKNQYHTFTEGQFTDMKVTINNNPNRPGFMTCTASPSSEWFSRMLYSQKIMAFGSPVVEIDVRAITFDQEGRYLSFAIPLSNGTGTFDVKSDDTWDYYSYHRAKYHYYFGDYIYNPVPNSGTITVHSIDLVNKTLSMSFNLQMVNDAGSTITFSNGQLNTQWLE